MGDKPSSAKADQAFQGNIPERATPEGQDAKPSPSVVSGDITRADFEALANFRYAIRRFLRFSEQEARKAGITPQQHQLLLAIKGFPNRESATVSELAERLQMRQHSMVGLIDRTETQGLVRRETGPIDRRQVYIYLTSQSEEVLRKLSVIHRRELQSMRDAFRLRIWEEPSPTDL